MFLDEISPFVGDIKIDAIRPQPFEFMVNGARHNIAWGQFTAFIKPVHKTCAIRQQQFATFTAYGFGNQEGFGLRVIQAGWMELAEFHIHHTASRTPGHGNAIAGRPIRV